MSPDIHASAMVNLLLNVSGNDFNSVTVQKTAEVIRQVTPVALQITPNVAEGSASVMVAVRNNSRIPSSSGVRIELSDSRGHREERNLGIVLAGQTTSSTFVINGLNPIDLLVGNGIQVRAQMLLGDLAVDELSGTIFSKNPKTDLPYAFAAAAQDASRQDQALALASELSERIRRETDSIERRGYKEHPGDTYLFGALSSYRSRSQAEVAKGLYSRLASLIWTDRKAFSNFLGIFKSFNRRYFENACRELNSGRKPKS
jgi:hypothetical protein